MRPTAFWIRPMTRRPVALAVVATQVIHSRALQRYLVIPHNFAEAFTVEHHKIVKPYHTTRACE